MDWGTTALQMGQVAVAVALTHSDMVGRGEVGEDGGQARCSKRRRRKRGLKTWQLVQKFEKEMKLVVKFNCIGCWRTLCMIIMMVRS